MLDQHPGKIFLAEQRGVLATSRFRRASTLNFGAYTAEHKHAFGRLHAFNEEVLGGGQQVAVKAPQASHVLIIPITGEVWVAEAGEGLPALISIAEMGVRTVPAGTMLHFTNPYPTELISFLHIWVSADGAEAPASRIFAMNDNKLANQLGLFTQVLPPAAGAPGALPFRVFLGQFAGRQEWRQALSEETAGCFAFVLAGAFEVNGRLLHAKDGLALWDTTEVEVEALSNDAVVLLLALDA